MLTKGTFMQSQKKKSYVFRPLMAIASLLVPFCGSVTAFADEKFDQISHLTSRPGMDIWEIRCPDVKKRTMDYRMISFRDGDVITIEAGGCVQTGGAGKTWKRYVDP